MSNSGQREAGYPRAIMSPAMESLQLLRQGAVELGLDLDESQLARFQRYHEELNAWNHRMNLTAIVDYEGVQIRHLLDSLTAAPILEERVRCGGSMMDIGSGGGFPGVPLKIAFPAMGLALMDSVGKKTTFLQHLRDTLELTELDVYTGRAEDLALRPELRENFDVVVTRGVAVMRVLMELTLPFCRPGGSVITWKKGELEPEIGDSLHAIEVLGGKLREVRPVDVEGLRDGRVLVIVDKIKSSPPKFPRRPGLPKKRPL